MKPTQPAATGRTPYAERERVIDDHCTCRWIWHPPIGNKPERHTIDRRDPLCPLHGDRREPAPF